MQLTLLPTRFRTHRARISLPAWKRFVAQILRRSSTIQQLDDAEFRKQSLSLKYRALSGEPLDELLVEGFALVREAARRTVDMQHYEVQLLGGIAMHFGCVAVMQTGEGKTLTASLPLYLQALSGAAPIWRRPTIIWPSATRN